MPRKQHRYHFIYKTTNLINDKFYVGMHSTSNLEDGYLGSGKRLWYSIQKHGKENHKMEILEFAEDRETLKIREREIINETFLENPLCMNLQLGGGGGFINKEHQHKCASAGGKIGGKIAGPSNIRKRNQKCKEQGTHFTLGFLGKKHSEKTKLKMSESLKGKQDGERNSQFGTCWITDGTTPIKIKKEFLQEYLDKGYVRGRKTF